MHIDLSGKRVIVTGASRGIRLAIATATATATATANVGERWGGVDVVVNRVACLAF